MTTARIKIFHFLTAALLLLGLFAFQVPASAEFNTFEGSCEAASSNGALTPTVCQEGPGTGNPIAGDQGVLTKAANIIAIITGIAAVIVIIVAGMTMTLSSGDSSKIRTSRDAIIYASIGLVVVGLARTLVVYLVNKVKR